MIQLNKSEISAIIVMSDTQLYNIKLCGVVIDEGLTMIQVEQYLEYYSGLPVSISSDPRDFSIEEVK